MAGCSLLPALMEAASAETCTVLISSWPTCAQDNFNETPTDACGEAELPAHLAGVHPDTPVMMYCTGGIRCDIYSTYLRSKVAPVLLGSWAALLALAEALGHMCRMGTPEP